MLQTQKSAEKVSSAIGTGLAARGGGLRRGEGLGRKIREGRREGGTEEEVEERYPSNDLHLSLSLFYLILFRCICT